MPKSLDQLYTETHTTTPSTPVAPQKSLLRRLGEGLIQSETRFGESMAAGQLHGTSDFQGYERSDAELRATRQKVYERIKEKQARGEDASELTRLLQETQGVSRESVYGNLQGSLEKTNAQVLGEAGGVALDIASFGSLPGTIKGLSTGVLGKGVATQAPKFAGAWQGFKALGKAGAKTGLKYGAGYGTAHGVLGGLQEGETDIGNLAMRGLEEGVTGAAVGTALGFTVGGAVGAYQGHKAAAATKRIDDARKAAGQILQGKKRDIDAGIRALKELDTTGVETYDDLSQALDQKARVLTDSVDNEMLQGAPVRRKLGELATETQVGADVVKSNYVEKALTHMREMYEKTDDFVNAAKMDQMLNQAAKDGLTRKEINDIARLYGSEFGKKAFSARTGEALTSVNARSYENIRKGVKEVARSLLPNDKTRLLDREISDILNTKRLVDRMSENVNGLQQRISDRNLVEKIARKAGQGVDIVTMGGPKAFVTKLLFPSNVGQKTLNSLDLQHLLRKNLQTVQKLSDMSDDTLVSVLGKKVHELGRKLFSPVKIEPSAGMSIKDVSKTPLGIMQHNRVGRLQGVEASEQRFMDYVASGAPNDAMKATASFLHNVSKQARWASGENNPALAKKLLTIEPGRIKSFGDLVKQVVEKGGKEAQQSPAVHVWLNQVKDMFEAWKLPIGTLNLKGFPEKAARDILKKGTWAAGVIGAGAVLGTGKKKLR